VTSRPQDIEFDLIVGALEEILLDDEFVNVQNSYFEKHYGS